MQRNRRSSQTPTSIQRVSPRSRRASCFRTSTGIRSSPASTFPVPVGYTISRGGADRSTPLTISRIVPSPPTLMTQVSGPSSAARCSASPGPFVMNRSVSCRFRSSPSRIRRAISGASPEPDTGLATITTFIGLAFLQVSNKFSNPGRVHTLYILVRVVHIERKPSSVTDHPGSIT